MADCRHYLNVLTDGLKKKNSILTSLVGCNERQAEAIKNQASLEEFDKIVEEKAVYIDELGRIDNGFQAVYDRIKTELTDHREEYREEIATLQDLIRQMTDLGVTVEAGEKRNKAAVEQYFAYTHNSVNRNRKSVKAVSDYYKNMSRVNYIDPQLLDQKK